MRTQSHKHTYTFARTHKHAADVVTFGERKLCLGLIAFKMFWNQVGGSHLSTASRKAVDMYRTQGCVDST